MSDVPFGNANPPNSSTSQTNSISGQPLKQKHLPVQPQSEPINQDPEPSEDNADDVEGGPSNTTKKAQQSSTISLHSPCKERVSKPMKANDWHTKKKDIPPEASKTKAIISAATMAQYNVCFNSEHQLAASVTASLVNNASTLFAVNTKIYELRSSLSLDGQIAKDISHTPEEFHRLMFCSVIQMGLLSWAPDIAGNDPESMYNLLHEHIALKTFEQISIAGGYTKSVEAHSDDEYAQIKMADGVKKEVYKIKKKVGHSEKYTAFYRMIDKVSYVTALQTKRWKKGTKVLREHVEIEGPDTPESTITTLPKHIAIDFFEPNHWNELLMVQKQIELLKDGYVVELPKLDMCKT
ncbi:hypothetical protein CVT25_015194 [Psilocybe cyanescens]|uniref:Uncharacterized protein n=1 Tax=Psilocybe cyanescens TaxID=93625 RepID=A0A409WRR3_PSICY|nr:hypothetical protein CVT25_015194 [Psilocybe cyanescens]